MKFFKKRWGQPRKGGAVRYQNNMTSVVVGSTQWGDEGKEITISKSRCRRSQRYQGILMQAAADCYRWWGTNCT